MEKLDMLPVELKRILNEIATTGMCPWLPWSRAAPRDQARPPGTAHAPAIASSAPDPASVSHLSGFMRENRSSMSAWTSSGSRQNPQLVSALQQHAATLNQQHSHLHHRRFQSSSPTAGGPPRKKHRNGLFGVTINQGFGDRKGKSRKRSLVHGWNSGGSATTTVTATMALPSSSSSSKLATASTMSGLASGSDDPEDASQSYDSEGTSASDLSGRRAASSNPPLHYQLLCSRNDLESSSYACQSDAFHEAAEVVLDYFHRAKGGYTMSPAEKAKSQRMSSDKASSGSASQDVFLQRRKRILSMFEPSSAVDPPYTIQRVAEVLLSPERYYSQTHKLCNALEKLLLVTSSAQSFGGYTGGVTAQSLREDQELAALAEEKRRIQLELRRRRLRHNSVNSALDEPSISSSSGAHQSGGETMDARATGHSGSDPESPGEDGYASGGSYSPELMEAAARASLRSKFDHVGIEPGSNRGDSRSGSPPPPALSISASATPGYVLPSHGGYSPPGKARTQSPILFNTGEGGVHSPPLGSTHPSPANVHLLQLHQHHGPSSQPLDLSSLHHHPRSPTERSLSPAAAGPSASASSSLLASVMMMMPSKEVDMESRSSASSDMDSESDVSFDDSASDRSDGSDLDSGVGAAAAATASVTPGTTGPAGTPIEPFSSSRAAAALSRIQLQQQQLLLQQRMLHASRILTSPTSPSVGPGPMGPGSTAATAAIPGPGSASPQGSGLISGGEATPAALSSSSSSPKGQALPATGGIVPNRTDPSRSSSSSDGDSSHGGGATAP
jgi:PPP4R2